MAVTASTQNLRGRDHAPCRLHRGRTTAARDKPCNLGFQMIMARVCSRMETPMAVIQRRRRGLLRSGR